MKRTVLLLSVFFAAATILASCGIDSKAEAVLRSAERLSLSSPDSALSVLKRIDPVSLRNPKLEAHYALLYSQALDGNRIDLQDDSVIAPAIAYFSRRGSRREKARTRYYTGCIRSNAGRVDEAVEQFVAAETDALACGDMHLLGRIYHCLANLYYSQYGFDEALVLYDKAERCFGVHGTDAEVASIVKARARVYLLQRRYAASESEFKRAIDLFARAGRMDEVCLVTRDLASAMLDRGDVCIESVERMLSRTYSLYTSGMIPRADYPLWARLYFRQNRIDSARRYALKAFDEVWESRDKRCGLYALMGRIEEASGDFRAAASCWKRYVTLYDSIVQDEKQQLVQRAEKRYRNRELRHQNELLRLYNKLICSVGVSVFFICILIFLLLLERRRRMLRKKGEQIRKCREFISLLNEEYAGLKNRYDRLAREMDQNSEVEKSLLKALETRLSGLRKLLDQAYAGCKPAAFVSAFKRYAVSLSGKDASFSDLQFVVNKRYAGIVDYLRENHPALTQTDLDVLCMLLFGFSFDCIRLIYNHDNIDSLYSRRTKIREKLRLSPRYRLERYLSELAERLKNEADSGRNGVKGKR